MKIAFTIMLATWVSWVTGCAGMGIKPMPDRLSEERQNGVNAAWEHFVATHPQIDRATLLDVVLMNQAWHVGVDELEIRSVKRVGNMFVVMETHFVRAKPEDDAFTFMLLDEFANVHRTEKFTADELNQAVESCLIAAGAEEKQNEETEEDYQFRLARAKELLARQENAKAAFPIPEPPSHEKESEQTEMSSDDE